MGQRQGCAGLISGASSGEDVVHYQDDKGNKFERSPISINPCANMVNANPCKDLAPGEDEKTIKATINQSLIRASRDGDVEKVREALMQGAGLECRKPFIVRPRGEVIDAAHIASEGMTPLMHACQQDHPKVVEILIRYGADVHASDEDAAQPFHFAAEAGALEACQLLLSAKADPFAPDADGNRAVDMCKAECKSKLEKLVESQSASKF